MEQNRIKWNKMDGKTSILINIDQDCSTLFNFIHKQG